MLNSKYQSLTVVIQPFLNKTALDVEGDPLAKYQDENSRSRWASGRMDREESWPPR